MPDLAAQRQPTSPGHPRRHGWCRARLIARQRAVLIHPKQPSDPGQRRSRRHTACRPARSARPPQDLRIGSGCLEQRRSFSKPSPELRVPRQSNHRVHLRFQPIAERTRIGLREFRIESRSTTRPAGSPSSSSGSAVRRVIQERAIIDDTNHDPAFRNEEATIGREAARWLADQGPSVILSMRSLTPSRVGSISCRLA